MQISRVIERPRSKGRFSRERDVWTLIHQDRFNRWIEGDPIDDIAQKHGVTCRSVHLSVAKVLAGLHRKRRAEALQFRNEYRNDWKRRLAGLDEYVALMEQVTQVSALVDKLRRNSVTRSTTKA